MQATEHDALAWSRQLLGQRAYDSRGGYLGIIEAVSTSRQGRLRRIGIRRGPTPKLTFLSAEGAHLQAGGIRLAIAEDA